MVESKTQTQWFNRPAKIQIAQESTLLVLETSVTKPWSKIQQVQAEAASVLLMITRPDVSMAKLS